MQRRTFLVAAGVAAGAAALPGAAHAQGALGRQITPQNPLEESFLAALEDEALRPAFRSLLLRSPIALALQYAAADADVRLVEIAPTIRAAAIFTSRERLRAVMGPAAAAVDVTGRTALTRVGARHAVLNYRLAPMLTLAPADVANLLALPDDEN